jgi:hypothetical protein
MSDSMTFGRAIKFFDEGHCVDVAKSQFAVVLEQYVEKCFCQFVSHPSHLELTVQMLATRRQLSPHLHR